MSERMEGGAQTRFVGVFSHPGDGDASQLRVAEPAMVALNNNNNNNNNEKKKQTKRKKNK